MSTTPNTTWHRSRILSIALILFGFAAVAVGLDDPQTSRDQPGVEQSAARSQQARADAIAGFPVAPQPDAPPPAPAVDPT